MNEGPRLENLVALSLYKEIQTKNDLEGAGLSLHYLRNKQKMEVDFLICKDKIPIQMIEVKLTDPSPSDSFAVFEKLMQPERALRKIQVVKNLDKPFKTKDSIEVISASSYLAGLDLK